MLFSMSAGPHEAMSEARYLELERTSLDKHEWIAGERYAMAGGTPMHAAICANVTSALRSALRGKGGGVASSDLRVHVPRTKFHTYPDVTVVCGRIETLATDETVILNPSLLVEVLSSSTEAYDRGAKFAHYERIPTLSEYLLVSADGRRLEHFRRIETGQWIRSVASIDEGTESVLSLPTFGISLAIADVIYGLEIFGG